MVNWLIVSCCLLGNAVFAQDTSLILVDSLPIASEFMTVDKLQNIYIFTKKNQFIKYNSAGKMLFQYESENFDQPSSIDVSNPLRPFLCFVDYAKAMTLDRTLSELYQYNLSDYDLDMKLAAPALDNGIWLYTWTGQFKKYSQQGKLEVESNNISSVFSNDFEPEQLFITERNIILHQAEKGTYIFDRYGQFLKKLPIIYSGEISIIDEWLIHFDKENNTLQFYHLEHSRASSLELPPFSHPILQVNKINQRIFIRTAPQVFILDYVK